MASAWLIRKFIDPKARFKFVPAKGYRLDKGELRFDMFEKDAKYGREEAPGIGQLVAGIAAAHPDDEARLARGGALFEDLYAVQGRTS